MKEDITLEELIKNFKFEDIKYLKNTENDHLHTLMPFESNGYMYALQSNEDIKVKHITNSLFNSFDQNNNFKINEFLERIEYKYNKDEYSISQEYLISDFLTTLIIGTAKEFSRVMQKFKLNKSNQISYLTMGRLPSTFQSANILIKNGFYFETKCLFRVILEQISYGYKCSGFDENKVDKLQPQKCISDLKELFEHAGQLNGLFSKYIHINKNIWYDFFDEENHIISRSGNRSKLDVLPFTFLAEMYIVVLYYIYKNLEDNDIDEKFHSFININIDIIEKVKSYFKSKENYNKE